MIMALKISDRPCKRHSPVYPDTGCLITTCKKCGMPIKPRGKAKIDGIFLYKAYSNRGDLLIIDTNDITLSRFS